MEGMLVNDLITAKTDGLTDVGIELLRLKQKKTLAERKAKNPDISLSP